MSFAPDVVQSASSDPVHVASFHVYVGRLFRARSAVALCGRPDVAMPNALLNERIATHPDVDYADMRTERSFCGSSGTV